MPIKDDEARRAYFRDYMAKRRAGEKPARATQQAVDSVALKARIRELEAEVTSLRARIAELEKPREATPDTTAAAPKAKRAATAPTPDERRAFVERMHADFEAHRRETAQWGGRLKEHVIADAERLVRFTGNMTDRGIIKVVVNAMLPHVREQANIQKGISRRTYRKVLADLHTDRNAASVDAFVAFKALDATRDNGKRNPNSIVIADDKVRTMADLERQRQERSARARAAAAKRDGKS